MTELTPYVFEGHHVRVVMIEGDPWWVLVDVCEVLGIAQAAAAVRRLDDDEYMQVDGTVISNHGGGPERYVINESGLYALILGSRKRAAKRFKRWVTHDVLPAIRKTGGYGTTAVDKWSDHPDVLATKRWLETNERVERVEITVDEQGCELKRVVDTTTRLERELAPKVQAYDAIMDAQGEYSLGEVAQTLHYRDEPKGASGRTTLIRKLRELGILCQPSEAEGTRARQEYVDRGFFINRLVPRRGNPRIRDAAAFVTPTGVEYLARRLGIIPSQRKGA